jgi:hypothetical protein
MSYFWIMTLKPSLWKVVVATNGDEVLIKRLGRRVG